MEYRTTMSTTVAFASNRYLAYDRIMRTVESYLTLIAVLEGDTNEISRLLLQNGRGRERIEQEAVDPLKRIDAKGVVPFRSDDRDLNP